MLDDAVIVDLSDEDDVQQLGDCSNKEHDAAHGTYGRDDEEESYELRPEKIFDVLRWEANCLGYNYLGFNGIQQHNSMMSPRGFVF